MAHAAHVGAQVILRHRQVAIAGKRGRHCGQAALNGSDWVRAGERNVPSTGSERPGINNQRVTVG